MTTLLDGLIVGVMSGVISGLIVAIWLQWFWSPSIAV
jgi:hypothetical protein